MFSPHYGFAYSADTTIFSPLLRHYIFRRFSSLPYASAAMLLPILMPFTPARAYDACRLREAACSLLFRYARLRCFRFYTMRGFMFDMLLLIRCCYAMPYMRLLMFSPLRRRFAFFSPRFRHAI